MTPLDKSLVDVNSAAKGPHDHHAGWVHYLWLTNLNISVRDLMMLHGPPNPLSTEYTDETSLCLASSTIGEKVYLKHPVDVVHVKPKVLKWETAAFGVMYIDPHD